TAQKLDSGGNKIEGGQVKIGNRAQFVSPWVPWGASGFSFLYDVLPRYDFVDYGVFPDPHTGLYIPIRSSFDVTTNGPIGKLAVPTTAYEFNASEVIDATHPTICTDYWHDDPTVIAAVADAYAQVFPSLSWDESKLALKTVFHDWTRVDQVTAEAESREALDFTKGASIGFM